MIEQNISLHDKNWFGTGGPARYFSQPVDGPEFSAALGFAREQGLDIFVLGQGANILIADHGFDGLVIRPALKQLVCNPVESTVTAGAGVGLHELIDYCLQNGLVGLEEFSGIPGTVGGSVFINIHYFKHLLSHFLVSAAVVQRVTGAVTTVDNAWFNFGYNQSTLLAGEFYLVSATFKLKPADNLAIAYAQGRRDEMIRHRNQRYPSARTCGSFFRNFHDHEIAVPINGKKIPFIAYYLDKIGIKGELRVGNAVVSYQHANMIVTLDGATSSDVVALARLMQERVFASFGLVPQSECQFIGFLEYPLHQSLPSKSHHSESLNDSQPSN